MPTHPIKLFTLICLALAAFAGNSVLCRLALGQGLIDASSFTSIRLMAGIITLTAICLVPIQGHSINVLKTLKQHNTFKAWLASTMLFIYAATFSYAYISLDTGTGALILFGIVQLSMIGIGVFYGNRLHYTEWLGIGIAFAGVVYLVKDDLTTPSLFGFVLMALSGVAWAIYTLLGRGSKQPIVDTTANFLRTFPFVIILFLFTLQDISLTRQGVIYAALSGSAASAVGYSIWYLILKDISVTQAAVIQLLVPILAAAGGIFLVNELVSSRLIIASLLVLGGITIVIVGRRYWIAKSL